MLSHRCLLGLMEGRGYDRVYQMVEDTHTSVFVNLPVFIFLAQSKAAVHAPARCSEYAHCFFGLIHFNLAEIFSVALYILN